MQRYTEKDAKGLEAFQAQIKRFADAHLAEKNLYVR
jgi:hypothetical protein